MAVLSAFSVPAPPSQPLPGQGQRASSLCRPTACVCSSVQCSLEQTKASQVLSNVGQKSPFLMYAFFLSLLCTLAYKAN